MTEYKDVQRKILEKKFSLALDNSEESIGRFMYRDLKIEIKRLRPKSGAERAAALYRRRRDGGMCIACGKKVTTRNPNSGKLYRLCEDHRTRIDKARGGGGPRGRRPGSGKGKKKR